jgi:hypothetical protein
MFREDNVIFKTYIRRIGQMMPADGIKRQMPLEILRAKEYNAEILQYMLLTKLYLALKVPSNPGRLTFLPGFFTFFLPF